MKAGVAQDGDEALLLLRGATRRSVRWGKKLQDGQHHLRIRHHYCPDAPKLQRSSMLVLTGKVRHVLKYTLLGLATHACSAG